MKKIIIYKVKDLLTETGCDDSTQELLLNNISLYNSLLTDFQAGERHNAYLLYQLNNAIQKEILSIKKHNKKIDSDDSFTKMIEDVKLKKIV